MRRCEGQKNQRGAKPSEPAYDAADGVLAGFNVRDRVVSRLIRKSIVTEEQVERSWEEWRRMREEGYKIALWRVLTLDPTLDRDKIYREAADVYAFSEIELSYDVALEFVEKTAEACFGVWKLSACRSAISLAP